MIDPERDGIDHINIYSKGKTELGRALSNFARQPFVHPRFGEFVSVEGLWYYLLASNAGPLKEKLRSMAGFEAKTYGRNLVGKDWDNSEWFKYIIIEALEIKANIPEIKEMLDANRLPFMHYYVYQGKVATVSQDRWILDFWESKSGRNAMLRSLE